MTNNNSGAKLKKRDFSCLREGWTFFTSAHPKTTGTPVTDKDCEDVVAHLNNDLKALEVDKNANTVKEDHVKPKGVPSDMTRESVKIFTSSTSITKLEAKQCPQVQTQSIFCIDMPTLTRAEACEHELEVEPEINLNLSEIQMLPNLNKDPLPKVALPPKAKIEHKKFVRPDKKPNPCVVNKPVPGDILFFADALRFEKKLAAVETVKPIDLFLSSSPGDKVTDWLERTRKVKESLYETRRKEALAALGRTDLASVRQREAPRTVRKEMEKELKRTVTEQLGVDEVIQELRHLENDKPIKMQLTAEQKKCFRAIMKEKPKVIVIRKFNIELTIGDLKSLSKKQTISDEIINFYMKLIVERSELNGMPRVYAMNTCFVQRIEADGYRAVKRWTRKVDIFAMDLIMIPVRRSGKHCCMAIIDLKNRTIKHYNPLADPDTSILKLLENYLRLESLHKKKTSFDTKDFEYVPAVIAPVQTYDYDCGVFSCMYAEYVSRNAPLAFGQQNMVYFRKKMIIDIAAGALLN